jgi:hypothetical protein
MKMPFRKITFGEANAKEEKVDSQPSASLRPWRHRSHEPEQGFRVAGAASLPPLNLPPIVPPQQRTPHRLLRRISRPPSPPTAVTSPASPPADRRQRQAGCSVLAGLPPFLHATSRCRWNPSFVPVDDLLPANPPCSRSSSGLALLTIQIMQQRIKLDRVTEQVYKRMQ